MANKKLSELAEKANLPTNALIHILDPNDLTQSPQGSDFKFDSTKLIPKSAIVDNLLSTSTTSVLSGNQGRILNENSSDNLIEAKEYADSLVIGLLDDRGNFNASSNLFPSSGGSGASGAVLKGDLWSISVAGTLGGFAVTAGDVCRALSDNPEQIASNWNITENNFGYVAENSANKQNSLLVDGTASKFPTVDATNAGLITKNQLIAHLEFNDADKTVWNNGKGDILSNTSFGENALESNTTGFQNTANGFDALKNNTTGVRNNSNGDSALVSNTTGSYNTANGSNSLSLNTTASNNTGIGASALNTCTTGSNNTGIASSSLFNNTTGSNNTGIGANSLQSNTTGSDNTSIGKGSNVSAGNLSNATAIGANAIVNASNKIQLGNTSVTSVETSGTVTAAPATLSTHLVTKSQLDTKISGSGTTDQLAKFTGSGAVGNSSIVEANNNLILVGNIDNSLKYFTAFSNNDDISSITGGQNGFATSPLLLNKTGGFVGVNQPAPTEQLDVVGNGKFSGSVIATEVNVNQSGNGFPVILSKTSGFGGALSLQNISTLSNDFIRFLNNDGTTLSQIKPALGGLLFSSTVSATSFNGSATLTGSPTAPTAATGTNTTQIATTAFVQAIRPYKVYVALLTQTGTNAPVATVLQNTFGETLTWSRGSAGFYNASIANGFDQTKTTLIIGIANSPGTIADFTIFSDAIISLNTKSSGTASDGALLRTSVEIRLYN